VQQADRYERQLAPIAVALIDSLSLTARHRVVDVGCGCGATTIAVARRCASAFGIDTSRPLIDVAIARARAASIDNAQFVVDDAQTYVFAKSAVDLVISQFGLMYFDDPVVAFTNLRRTLVTGGRMAFTCWQGIENNEWIQIVARAVAEYVTVPALGGRSRGAGMFSLQSPEETNELLRVSGFADIDVAAMSPSVVIGGGGTLDESIEFLTGSSIARGLLGLLSPNERSLAVSAIGRSLTDRFESGVGVSLGTGVWLVSATNPH